LENEEARYCTGSHFDERLFYSELMGPIISQISDILSPLTLAVLDDSGWYQVNYQISQVSPFGFGRRLRICKRPMHH
jgi:leishmanolysin-like peptidase